MDQPTQYVTFVVRLERRAADEMAGVVEQVRTGEKARFRGVESIGGVIAGMLRRRDKEPDG